MAVSIIIPTLNESNCIGATIRSVRRQTPHEIIVVDGGSTDDTLRMASAADVVMKAPRGRAAQMNAGGNRALGSTLLFLHADCTLEEGALEQAERFLLEEHVVAGCFRMHVCQPGLLYKSINACANLRVRLTGLIYGDQGLFMRHETFAQLGGFPKLGLMEDVYISKRLRRLGKMVIAPRKIYVSPRRWQSSGLIRQTLRNWTLTVLAGAGVHPDRLTRYYPVVR